MGKNIIKMTLMTAIMFLGVFFINVDSAKAMGKPDNKGYAECWYDWSVTTTTGVMSKSRHFLMAITVFRNTDGNYDGYAVTGCGENDITSNNINSNKCTLKNYNAVFNTVSSSALKKKFKNDLTKKWQCPTIYVKSQANSNDVELSWKEKSGFKKIPDRGATVSDKSKQSGAPTLNNETINNINPYTKDKEGNYDKNSSSEKSQIDEITNWGKKGKDNESYDTNEGNCAIIPSDLQEKLSQLFWVITIVGILLLIIMTSIEFIKVITASEEDGLKGAFKHTVIRAICVIILLLLPTLINAIIVIINDSNIQKDSDGQIVIGEEGDPLCKVAQ